MIINEPATGDQLRRLWHNLKTRQREALTKERQHRLATGGGGPCPDAQVDPNIEEVAPALLVEISEAIDSDTSGIISTPEDQPPQSPCFPLRLPSTTTSSVQPSFPSPLLLPSTSYFEPSLPSPLLLPPTCSVQTSLPSSLLLPSTSSETSLHPFSIPSSHLPSLPSSFPSHFSTNNEKKLRLQILTDEHKNRERRAEEKHNLDMLILRQKLKEAEYKAELAAQQLRSSQNQ